MDQEGTKSYDLHTILLSISSEIDNPYPNWGVCLKKFMDLGQIVTLLPEKEIESPIFLQVFQTFTKFIDSNKNVPLAIRILMIKVLQNSAIVLAKNVENSSYYNAAISLVCSEFISECEKEKPSSGYIITIMDAFKSFLIKGICDEQEIVESILKVQVMLTKFQDKVDFKHLYIKMAYAFDMSPLFSQKFNIGRFEKRLNELSEFLGCHDLKTRARTTISLPKRYTLSATKRLELQMGLQMLSTEQVLNLVLEMLDKFSPVPNFIISDTVNLAISKLMDIEVRKTSVEQIDLSSNSIETAKYIIEQGLDRMTSIVKFAPIKTQSRFLSMMITTTDEGDKDFLKCASPCTFKALEKSLQDVDRLLPFIINWTQYEYICSPRERYQNLTFTIIEYLSHLLEHQFSNKSEAELIGEETINDLDDADLSKDTGDRKKEEENSTTVTNNYLLSYITELPFYDQVFVEKLVELARTDTHVSGIIVYAAVSLVGANCLQEFLVENLLDLSVDPLRLIAKPSFQIVVKKFYKVGLYVDRIKRCAIDCLVAATGEPTRQGADRFLNFFFSILAFDTTLLEQLLDSFGNFSDDVSKDVLKRLGARVNDIGFCDTIKSLIERAGPENIKMVHFLLRLLSNIGRFPEDLSRLIEHQYEVTKDARYIIPIIPTIKQERFFQYLPAILGLKPSARKIAAKTYIARYNNRNAKVFFLIELLAPQQTEALERSAAAMIHYLMDDLGSKMPYKFVAAAVSSAVTNTMTNRSINLVVSTLLDMLHIHPDSVSYIVSLLPQLIQRGACDCAKWDLFKQLLEEMVPQSIKYMYLMPLEKLMDFVETYPDRLTNLINDSRKYRVDPKVVRTLESMKV